VVIGRGDKSRLNKTLLKEKRLVHSIAAWNYTPRDPGLFVITAVLDFKNLAPAEEAISKELELIRRGATENITIDEHKKKLQTPGHRLQASNRRAQI